MIAALIRPTFLMHDFESVMPKAAKVVAAAASLVTETGSKA
jgi:hypothetical protein